MDVDGIPFCGNGIIWPGHGPRPGQAFQGVSVLGSLGALMPVVQPAAIFAR